MKKYLLGAAILCFVVCFSAFTAKSDVQKNQTTETVTYMWFDFAGNSLGDYSNLSLYSQDPDHVDPCEGAGIRCEIYAPVITSGSNAGKPDLDDIQDETFKP
ncbi:MAG: hypothetical protein ABIO02_05055 [Patescibacteria group bacterium]